MMQSVIAGSALSMVYYKLCILWRVNMYNVLDFVGIF